MKLMPRSIASRTIRMLSCSSNFLRPRCQPPRPMAETCSLVLPRTRYGISPCTVLFAMISSLSELPVLLFFRLGFVACRTHAHGSRSSISPIRLPSRWFRSALLRGVSCGVHAPKINSFPLNAHSFRSAAPRRSRLKFAWRSARTLPFDR